MDLCNPREVRALLDRYGLAPQKGFGQNFLINPDIPERIAESSYSAVRSRPCAALEIGPGIGALTSSLCERFDRVVAVEIDRGLLPLLDETLGDYDNVTVVSADFMTIDVAEFSVIYYYTDHNEAVGVVSRVRSNADIVNDIYGSA